MQVLERISDRHEDILKVRVVCTESVINALRRTMYREVPIVAVDDVIIHVNESIHHNLFMADRIRLITMKTNADAIGSSALVKEYTFDYTNSSDDASDDGYTHITAGDIFGDDAVNPKTMIVKLKNSERLHVTVRTAIGTGATHSKYYPVAPVTFHKVESAAEEDDSSDAEHLSEYDMTIESTRSLPADAILYSAVDIILAKLKGVREAVAAASSVSSTSSVSPASSTVKTKSVSDAAASDAASDDDE